ncbi:MAG: penicillin-binding protein 2 [Candidatus Aminicenantes bacterium RBG_13_63_10]|nr:MAG: penicillin-binding protein 2 [Candidatus Aminicenantes bacterium RBG_13_63_10]
MADNLIYEDLSPVRRRALKWVFVVEILFVLIAFYYWKIQILDHQAFWKLAEKNRIREVVLTAPRGLITDRKGVILAKNVGSFTASLIPENTPDLEESFAAISRLLDIPQEELRRRAERYGRQPAFKPLPVKENLTLEEVSRIDARQLEFPELVIVAEPKRYYSFGTRASHLLGYLQEISGTELKRPALQDRRLGELIGKMGLEAEYESFLVGRNGRLVEVVDNHGRRQGELERQEPQTCPPLTLHLDFDLQKKAEDLLEGREGAVVVLDLKTGGVLALASYPTFDPNKFINRFTPEEWRSLALSPDFPLENRAIRGVYAPGSLFKLTIGLVALNTGLVDERTTFFCGGTIIIYGEPFNCWAAGGHGSQNLTEAIRNSCNVYFYNLGKRLSIEDIARHAKLYGFGRRTGIDLPGEKEGLVPTPEWKKKNRNAPWFPGETISVSIGQGPLLVTPLQVAAHAAFIARRGQGLVPHLLLSAGSLQRNFDPEGGADVLLRTDIKRTSFDKIINGMWESVNREGTGRAAKVEGYNVCGKTGSTQTVSAQRADRLARRYKDIKTHSWFTGFAPRDDPEVAVTVLVEFGGMGGATAAPLARELFALYRQLKSVER